MICSFLQALASSLVYFFYDDPEFKNSAAKNTIIPIFGIFTYVTLAGVQIFYVKQMGEVYIKITSDNPQESINRQNKL